jgi:hypothetical protein
VHGGGCPHLHTQRDTHIQKDDDDDERKEEMGLNGQQGHIHMQKTPEDPSIIHSHT